MTKLLRRIKRYRRNARVWTRLRTDGLRTPLLHAPTAGLAPAQPGLGSGVR